MWQNVEFSVGCERNLPDCCKIRIACAYRLAPVLDWKTDAFAFRLSSREFKMPNGRSCPQVYELARLANGQQIMTASPTRV